MLAFIEGIGFDPFFRGLLSVVAISIVLIGGTYLIVATNTGVRGGFLISGAALFGWMFLMGIVWTIYGIGWVGEAPSWEAVEINFDDPGDTDDGLLFSEFEPAQELFGVDVGVQMDDPDAAQVAALERSREMDLSGWRYLPTSDGVRGEAQAVVDTILVEEGVFGAGEYLPLQFGGFTYGGKPVLQDDPTIVDQTLHFFDETFLNPLHPDVYMLVQVQGTVAKPSIPGEPPPLAEIDPEQPLVSVILQGDRGGPFPSLISGLRFTPLMFTVLNGALMLIFALVLHLRDRRIDEIRAAAAA
jgi:hypothetical protein